MARLLLASTVFLWQAWSLAAEAGGPVGPRNVEALDR